MSDVSTADGYLSTRFGLTGLRSHVSRSLSSGVLSVTELVSDVPMDAPSVNMGYVDAFMVGLQIAPSKHEMWFDGRPVASPPFAPGQTAFYDLRRDPAVYVPGPYHSLQFYLPLAVVGEMAGGRAVSDLWVKPGASLDDPIIQRLGQALAPAFRRSGAGAGLFLDHMLNALAAHVAYAYGGAVPERGPAGLAPWQAARAKALMRARLDEALTLADLAGACGLSVSHFARAFRASTGMAPHRWLMRLRVERAKALMATSRLPLSQVGLACGFADQSHFTRVFRREVGASPASWRRERGPLSQG